LIRKVFLFLFLFLILFVLSFSLLAPGKFLRAFDKVKIFSLDCPKETVKRYSNRLNDRMPSYIEKAKKNGIERCKNLEALKENESLERIHDNRRYRISNLTYSYPYLTKDGKDLLDTIAERFSKKIEDSDLKNSRFIITSVTRTVESLEKLKENNINASAESAHMYAECFDIAYSRFSKPFTALKDCHIYYLKEKLAEVLFELRKEKRCWALTERKMPCYHVVCR
jgi:hypothetical protein